MEYRGKITTNKTEGRIVGSSCEGTWPIGREGIKYDLQSIEVAKGHRALIENNPDISKIESIVEFSD